MKRSWLVSLLVLALTGCGNPAPSAVPILQQAAEAAAIAQADGTNVHVASTRLSTYGTAAGSGGASASASPTRELDSSPFNPAWIIAGFP